MHHRKQVFALNRREIVDQILPGRDKPRRDAGSAFAPVNIALCKYWGKRDTNLNLPLTSSLSVSLATLGAETMVRLREDDYDHFVLNGQDIGPESTAGRRVIEYLDLFRPTPEIRFAVESTTNVPVAAGVASSAAGFAALAKALDNLFDWGLPDRQLSILSRLGSGSACRSVYEGFVEWHAGEAADGMDSYAVPIDCRWPGFCMALVEISGEQKHIGSREAMARTVATSEFYRQWPERVKNDMAELKTGIEAKDIQKVGETAEANALAMHATMLDTRPPILYWRKETVETMGKIWTLRSDGLPVYFTMDAGPNVKLIFEQSCRETVEERLSPSKVVMPFDY